MGASAKRRRKLLKKQTDRAEESTAVAELNKPLSHPSFLSDEALFVVDKKGQDEAAAAKPSGPRCLATLKGMQLPVLKEERKSGDARRIKALRSNWENIAKSEAGQPKAIENGAYDLWGEASASKAAPTNSKKAAKPIPSIYTAANVVEAGASYRPDPLQHKQLLDKAKAYEAKNHKRNQKHKKNHPMFSNVLTVEIHKEGAEEDEDEGNEERAGEVEKTIAKRVKLTQTQRNKQLRKKKLELIMLRQKQRKLQTKQLNKLDSIVAEIEEEEQTRKKRKQANSGYVPPKIGRARAEPSRPIAISAASLPKKLRQSKGEGNLLLDRLRNLQQRNLLPPTTKRPPMKKRPAKYYSTEKHLDAYIDSK